MRSPHPTGRRRIVEGEVAATAEGLGVIGAKLGLAQPVRAAAGHSNVAITSAYLHFVVHDKEPIGILFRVD